MGDYEGIEKYMLENESYLMSLTDIMFSYCAFVFPDGKSVRVGSHDRAAEAVGEKLNLDVKKSTDLERYGIVRTGKGIDAFYINGYDIPSKLAEETIKDQIVNTNPSEIIVSFDSMHKKQSAFDAFKKRLDRQFNVQII